MSIFKKYPLRERNPETASGSPAEAVVAEARREGVKLDKARLRENNDHFFQRIREEKRNLGITEDIESSSNALENQVRALMEISEILSSGDRESIKKIQEIINERLRGEAKIAENGVLGQSTINALKWYYNTDMKIKGMSPESPSGDVEIYDATIIGKNLTEVADEDTAMNLAEKIIDGFAGESDQAQRKKLIKKWQKEHGIGDDGKIGKETYVEMRAEKLITNEDGELSVDIINNNLDTEEIQGEILWVLDHGTHTGKNIMGIVAALDAFKKEHAEEKDFESLYGDFFKQVDILGKRFIESAAGKKSVKDAEAASASLYGIASDPNLSEMEKVEKILLDPAVLMVGGVLFLFGVFGAETPYTDGFFKRLGWLIGAAVFGKAAWEKIGGPEILADAKGAMNAPKATAAYESTKNKVSEWLGKNVPGIDADSEVTQKAGDKFDRLMISIGETNLGFLTSDPEKSVDPEKLVTLGSIWESSTLGTLSVEALRDISSMADLNGYLSGDQQEALRKMKIEWKDIHNYLNIVIPKLEGGSFVDTLLAGAADTVGTVAGKGVEFMGGRFFENEKLNSIVQAELAPLYLTGSAAEQKASRDFTNAVLSIGIGTIMGNEIRIGARFNQFDIDTYGLTDTEKAEFQKKIDKIAFIAEGERHIREKTKAVYDIQIVETGAIPDTAETLKKKIAALDAIKLDDALLTDYGLTPDMFSKEKFQQQFEAKKAELFKKARELGVTEVVFGGTTVAIAAVISGIEQQNTLAADEEVLKTLAEIPSVTATPLTFMNYHREHASDFENAQAIVTRYSAAALGSAEAKLRDEAQARISLFKTNYETRRAVDVQKIADYKTRIEAIPLQNVNETNFLERRRKLEAIAKEHAELRTEIVQGYTLGDVTTLWNRYMGDRYAAEPEKNSFEYLDAITGITTAKPNVDEIQGLVQDRAARLEAAFVVDIDISSVSMGNETSIQDFVREVEAKWTIISLFETGNKARKTEELKNQVDKVVQLYITAIQSSTTLTDAEVLYNSYYRNIENKVGGKIITAIGGLIENGSAVEDALKERATQEKRNQVLLTAIGDTKTIEILKSSGVYDFFKENLEYPSISSMEGSLQANNTLEQVQIGLEVLSNDTSLAPEVQEKIKQLLKSLTTKIDIEINGWLQVYYEELKEQFKI